MVNVKVAVTEPVLPSVTNASLTETDGGTNGQDWLLIRTEALVPSSLAVATSSQPSPFQSPAVSAEGRGPAAKVSAVEKAPLPRPRRMLTLLAALSVVAIS